MAAVNRSAIWFCLVASAIIPSTSSLAALDKLGAMGDSLTDEYWDAGTSSYATNWVDQLVIFRGINFGPTAAQAGVGTWGSPRNAGYEFNWALSGETSASLLSDGQDTGLAAQVASMGVSNAVLAIGGNDFNPATGDAFLSIYSGLWNAGEIQAYANQTVSNIETALVTVKNAGASVVVANVIDPGLTPAVASVATSVSGRQNVSAAIQLVNRGVKALAQKYQVPMVDWYGFETALLGPNTSLKSTALIGNVAINLRGIDPGPPLSDPKDAFVSDGFHPNTVIQGILANLILLAFDNGYGDSVQLFSEQEILGHAQITYGGSDTLQSQIGAYTNFVVLPAPLKVNSVSVSGASLTIGFSAVPNQSYAIESRDDLTSGSWTTVTNNISGASGITTVTLPDEFSAGSLQRFYRVRQSP
ncbi:MAG TPA: SGNH/GDSL hydrolase family protein [Verrucomicrobiae bacterium]